MADNMNDLFSRMQCTNSQGEEITKEEQEVFNKAVEEEKQKAEEEKQKVFRNTVIEFVEKNEQLSNNYILGFFGALGGAIIGSILLGFVYSICFNENMQKTLVINFLEVFPYGEGVINIILGMIVRLAMMFILFIPSLIILLALKGYNMCKVKTSKHKARIILLASMLSVFAGQIVSDIIFVYCNPKSNLQFGETILYYFGNFSENFYCDPNGVLAVGIIMVLGCSFFVLAKVRKENKIIEAVKKERKEYE